MGNKTAFKQAYLQLKNKDDWKFSIQIYHHNNMSEPFFSSESDVERVNLDYVEEQGMIITIMTTEMILSFNEANYMAHADESYVSFGSRYDNETYCIIEFC